MEVEAYRAMAGAAPLGSCDCSTTKYSEGVGDQGDDVAHLGPRHAGFTRFRLVIHRLKGKTAGDWDMTLSGLSGPPCVKQLEHDGLGFRSGVRPEDRLVSINGVLVSGHAEGVLALDQANGHCVLVVDRPATDPIRGIVSCCMGAMLLALAVAVAACNAHSVLVQLNLAGDAPIDQPDALRARDLLPRLRYGGPESWRARCFPRRTHFSVASWPAFAPNATRRWEVSVKADAEAVAVSTHGSWQWHTQTPLCILSARTGLPVDNWLLQRILSPAQPRRGGRGAKAKRGGATGAPDASSSSSSSSSSAPSLALLFEPVSGPGVYEVYDSCDDPFRAEVSAQWRRDALQAAQATERDETRRSAVWRMASGGRLVHRSSTPLAAPWTLPGGGQDTEWHARQQRAFVGNVRAVVRVPDAEANASEPAMRVLVRWRRPRGSATTHGPEPTAVRLSPGVPGAAPLETPISVPVALLGANEDEVELLLAHDNVPGTYLIYLLPFERSTAAFDAGGLTSGSDTSGEAARRKAALPSAFDGRGSTGSRPHEVRKERFKRFFSRLSRPRRTERQLDNPANQSADGLIGESIGTQADGQPEEQRSSGVIGAVADTYEALAQRERRRSELRLALQANARRIRERRRNAEMAMLGLGCTQAGEVQSRTAFDHVSDMERAADMSEIQEMERRAAMGMQTNLSGLGAPGTAGDPSLFMFAESRTRPLRTSCELPRRWAVKGPKKELRSVVRPGEFFVWHVGLWSREHALQVADCSLHAAHWSATNGDRSARRGASEGRGPALSSSVDFRCISVHGVAHDGRPLKVQPAAPAGCARSLWFGVQVPNGTDGRVLRLTLELKVVVRGMARAVRSRVVLFPRGSAVRASGDDQLWRLSRLRWLDSRAGHELDEGTPSPFTPVRAALVKAPKGGKGGGRQATAPLLLSAKMGQARIGINGLPKQLFAGGRNRASKPSVAVLESPIEMRVYAASSAHRLAPSVGLEAFQEARWAQSRVQWRVVQPVHLIPAMKTKRRAAFKAALVEAASGDPSGVGSGNSSSSSRLRMEVSGTWLYDTELKMRIRLTALRDVSLRDVSLVVPFRTRLSQYLMGFERHGRKSERHLPLSWNWKAGSSANQVWMGDVHAGMRLKLTGADSDAWDSPMHKVSEDELHKLYDTHRRRSAARHDVLGLLSPFTALPIFFLSCSVSSRRAEPPPLPALDWQVVAQRVPWACACDTQSKCARADWHPAATPRAARRLCVRTAADTDAASRAAPLSALAR